MIMVGGSLVANAVNYLYHLIMGRILGPVDYGVLASIFSILYIISVVPASASFAIVKFISSAGSEKERKDIYHGIRNFIIKVSLGIFVILAVLTMPVSGFLHIDNFWLIALVAPITYINLITLVNQAVSQGILKFEGSIGPTVISAVFKLGLGLLFVYLGFSVLGAVFGVLLSIVAAYVYSKKFIKRYNRPDSKTPYNLAPFLKYALPVLLQAFAFTSLFTMDIILVKHFLPAFDAGIYAALSTLGKIIYFAVQPITATMFPIVNSRRVKGGNYKNIFYLSFAATIAVSSLVVLFYYLFPNIAIGVLYGKDYLSAKGDLIWMGIFMLFYTACYNLASFLISVDKVKVVWLTGAAAVTQIVAIFIWHGSIREIIQVSLVITVALTGLLTVAYAKN